MATLRLASTFLFARRRRCDAIAGFLVSTRRVPGRAAWVRAGMRAARALPARSAPRAETVLDCAILAKAPQSAAERGIVFVSFEHELEKLLEHRRFAAIEAEYLIAFLPSWQPSYSRALFGLAARATRPYAVLPASPWEQQHLAAELGPLCIALPLHAGSWVPQHLFPPAEHKDIDLLMVANFATYKRHWKLFEALSQIPERYRTVCVGRPWGGRTERDVRREAAAFGVAHRVEVLTNVDARVPELLARARLFCALSHKEGSFIAVAEAMIAGTAVAMFANAIIGSKSFVNAETGFLFDPSRPLGPQLRDALARAPALRPDLWARQHIGADVSMRRFNEAMRHHALRYGLPWTRDAAPIFCRHFVFGYRDAADAQRLAPAYARLHDAYQIRIASERD